MKIESYDGTAVTNTPRNRREDCDSGKEETTIKEIREGTKKRMDDRPEEIFNKEVIMCPKK